MTFPLTLDMAPFVVTEASGASPPLQYELYAVLLHTGSAMAGHYFACVVPRAPRRPRIPRKFMATAQVH